MQSKKVVVLVPTVLAYTDHPSHFTKGKRYKAIYTFKDVEGRGVYKYHTNKGTDLNWTKDRNDVFMVEATLENKIGGKLC